MQHSLALIVLQTLILAFSYLLSRGIFFNYNVQAIPFILMIVPAIIFSVWTVGVWGSPIVRTQAGFFLGSSAIDYRWATDIALRELEDYAFAIPPRTGIDMFLNMAYLFVAPAIGGLFFVPKVVGMLRGTRPNGITRLFIVVFLVVVMNWLTVIGGFIYTDASTFRHLFDVAVVLSILAAVGMVYFIEGPFTSRHQHLIFLIIITLFFAIEMLTYFDFNNSTFSLNSRIILAEPVIRFAITSVAVFSFLYLIEDSTKKYINRTHPYILGIVFVAIVASAIIPTLAGTASKIAANNASYEKTYESNLVDSGWYEKHLQIQKYFSSRNPDGGVLVYGVNSLDYRNPAWDVYEMSVIIDLALLKPVLTGNSTNEVIQKLKDNNIRYVVVPLSDEGAERFVRLYKYTKLIDILNGPNAFLISKYDNFGIFELRY